MDKIKPKERAQEIFNTHYMPILEFGEEMSEECVVSILANKAAIITQQRIINKLKEYGTVSEYENEVLNELKK